MGGVAGLADKPHVLYNTPSHIKNECTPKAHSAKQQQQQKKKKKQPKATDDDEAEQGRVPDGLGGLGHLS